MFVLAIATGVIAQEYPTFTGNQKTTVTSWIDNWGDAGPSDYPDAYGYNDAGGDFPPDDQMNWVSQLIQVDYYVPFGGEEFLFTYGRPWNFPLYSGDDTWADMLGGDGDWRYFFNNNQNQQPFPSTYPDWPDQMITTMNGNETLGTITYSQYYFWDKFNSNELLQDYYTCTEWELDEFIDGANGGRTWPEHRVTIGSVLLLTEDPDENDGYVVYAVTYEEPLGLNDDYYEGYFDVHCRNLMGDNATEPIPFRTLLTGLGNTSNYSVYFSRNDASAAR